MFHNLFKTCHMNIKQIGTFNEVALSVKPGGGRDLQSSSESELES